MLSRVDGFPVHASIVTGSEFAHNIGAVTYHRVDGKPSTLRFSSTKSISRAAHFVVFSRVPHLHFPATLRQHKRRAMALPYSQFLQVFAFLHGEPVPTGSFAAPIAVSVYPC